MSTKLKIFAALIVCVGCGNAKDFNDLPRKPYGTCAPDSYSDREVPASKFSALIGMPVGPTVHEISGDDPGAKLIRPFYSDGCSNSPDGVPLGSNKRIWFHCCYIHDTKYWLGGTEDDKRQADAELESCVAQAGSGYPRIGAVYGKFVDLFGGPDSRQTYRWGYGWNYSRPFAALTPDEKVQIDRLYDVNLDDVFASLKPRTEHVAWMCSTFDPIFFGYTPEDKAAFQYLNERMPFNSVIERAEYGYFNLERREFIVQVEGCQSPAWIVFERNSPRIIDATFRCD